LRPGLGFWTLFISKGYRPKIWTLESFGHDFLDFTVIQLNTTEGGISTLGTTLALMIMIRPMIIRGHPFMTSTWRWEGSLASGGRMWTGEGSQPHMDVHIEH